MLTVFEDDLSRVASLVDVYKHSHAVNAVYAAGVKLTQHGAAQRRQSGEFHMSRRKQELRDF
jgi:hypothetical protein